jgi:hypothetical protein
MGQPRPVKIQTRDFDMSYQVSTLDDGHILILTLCDDFDIMVEFSPSFTECFEYLEAGPDRVVFISDARQLQLKSFNDLLQGSSMTRSPESARVNKHPKVIKVFTITNSTGIALAAKGLNSASFGFLELGVFSTLEDAIEAARAVIRDSA